MAKLFGFSIEDTEQKSKSIVSPVPPNNEDGVDHFIQSGFYGQYVDIEGVYRTEYDLIRRYREMALHPECDGAIENVVNEAIVSDLYDSPVEIELSNLNASDRLKEVIRAEFKYIKEILDFDKKSHEIFRNWYIDGRLFYLKVIDQKNPEAGIQELRYIDPMKMKHVRQEKKTGNDSNGTRNLNLLSRSFGQDQEYNFPEIEEYFIYTPTPNFPMGTISGGSKKGVKIAKDSITYCTSGLVDRNKGTVLSYLHKAIKALNQLRMIEDSLVIYRLSRAPERRIFYIDVGNLPKVKAEQYLKEVMSRYRNKLVYDANTGEIRDDRKFMSMLEDFWLPRREGGRGTEITTLPGGQNLGELSDIEYFQKKLYRALGVPETRIAGGGDGFNLGRSSEILRDELMFSKFVGRLRKRFANLFNDMLRTQLLLKNIVSLEDWEQMSDHIQYDFLYDNHFSELKEAELLTNRLTLATTIEPYIGKYYSTEYVRKKILRQTDSEIIEIDLQIEDEIAKGILPDPNAPVDEMGNPLPPEEGAGEAIEQGAGGEIPIEPTVNVSAAEIQTPKGGKI
ncbi:portal protein [Synechococcus phage S-SRM01]|uniref:Portal protein n=1 Tax=Synechococcus phage S-SRM01 TaxID=2781608 RepID=A0A879R3N7_9CAUD|nr:portal protein [Synechococcus phage S-SRM01]QPX48178.1 portal vertex protein of head [Synechococcus phage S-SRM01]